jgi:hypothetical protein
MYWTYSGHAVSVKLCGIGIYDHASISWSPWPPWLPGSRTTQIRGLPPGRPHRTADTDAWLASPGMGGGQRGRSKRRPYMNGRAALGMGGTHTRLPQGLPVHLCLPTGL